MSLLFEFDKNINREILIGTDEAGRGPGAGDVFAAAVCFFNYNQELIEELSDINDSKKLSHKKRSILFEKIVKNSYYSIIQGSLNNIEKYNILNASLFAMKEAVTNVLQELPRKSDALVLVDGNKKIKDTTFEQMNVIKGDSKSAVIAAASILAKESRDIYMINLHNKYPMYNWAKNKGYLTKEHILALKEYGQTEFHRKKFISKFITT